MKAVKKRHNITISPEVWEILTELKRLQGKSISEIVESVVKKTIQHEGYNPTYFKIMSSVPYCNDEENEELTKILDSLTEDDLKVVEKYEI